MAGQAHLQRTDESKGRSRAAIARHACAPSVRAMKPQAPVVYLRTLSTSSNSSAELTLIVVLELYRWSCIGHSLHCQCEKFGLRRDSMEWCLDQFGLLLKIRILYGC